MGIDDICSLASNRNNCNTQYIIKTALSADFTAFRSGLCVLCQFRTNYHRISIHEAVTNLHDTQQVIHVARLTSSLY